MLISVPDATAVFLDVSRFRTAQHKPAGRVWQSGDRDIADGIAQRPVIYLAESADSACHGSRVPIGVRTRHDPSQLPPLGVRLERAGDQSADAIILWQRGLQIVLDRRQ